MLGTVTVFVVGTLRSKHNTRYWFRDWEPILEASVIFMV